MTSAARPEVILELDRPRRACLDLNAMCAIEERLGRSIFRAIRWEELGIRDILHIVWGSLLSDDPGLKFEDVTKLLTPARLLELQPQVGELIAAAFPAKEEAGAEEKKE